MFYARGRVQGMFNLFKKFSMLRSNRLFSVTADVDGMRCEKCVERVRNALLKVSGVVMVNVDSEKKVVIIESDREQDLAKISKVISDCGYSVREIRHSGITLVR